MKAKTMHILALCLLALSVFTACKPKSTTNRQGYVLGDSNDIEIYKGSSDTKGKDIPASIALIVTTVDGGKRKFCTGSLVKHQEQTGILTNFHCFANATDDGKVESFFFAEACVATKVYFEFTKSNHEKVKAYQCKTGTLFGDHDGDLAFFKLEEDAEVLEAREPLKFSDQGNPTSVEAQIFHHPDVPENYVAVANEGMSMPAMAITRKNCKVNQRFDTKEWPLDPTLPFSLKHTCDLIHGSSGSPLLHAKTGAILGINWGGIEIEYKKGSDISNAATSADYVTAFLEGQTETVRRHAEDVTAMEIKNQSKKEKSGVLKNIQNCGTVAGTASSHWMLFALPFLIFLRRKRSR